MKGLKRIFRASGFHRFLFFLSACFLSWPLMTIVEKEEGAALFIYLFSIWGIVILFLFFIARSIPLDNSDEPKGKKER